MLKTFSVFRNAGQNWVPGKRVREQPLWDEHAAFMDKLFEDGHIYLAGPFTDGSGALVIVNAENEAGAIALPHDDP